MTALTLYQIADDFRKTAAILAELDLDEQTIRDTLEGELAPFEDKARAVACVLTNIEAESEAYANHAAKASERANALEKRAKSLRAYLLTQMTVCGISEIKGSGLLLKLQNNPASVDVLDERQIPAEYMRTPPPPAAEPNKKLIGEALKSGIEIPGCKLKQTQRLVIK